MKHRRLGWALLLCGCAETVASARGGAPDATPSPDVGSSVDASTDGTAPFDATPDRAQEDATMPTEVASDVTTDLGAELGTDVADSDARTDASDARTDASDATDAAAMTLRLLSPMSGSIMTRTLPLVRWETPVGAPMVRLEFCADRACARVLSTVTTRGTSERPETNLPAGAVFWRVTSLESAPMSTPVWEMVIPTRASPREAIVGCVLDVNGDGLTDAVASGNTSFAGAAIFEVRGDPMLAMRFGPSDSVRPPDVRGFAFVALSLAAAGDLNGDGYGDAASTGDGALHLYYGSATGLSGATARTMTVPELGAGPLGSTGIAVVAGAGDLNRDGYGDLVVGVPEARGLTGCVHLFRGGPGGLERTPAVTLYGTEPGARFGTSVAGVGDVDGDGLVEVAITSFPPRATATLWVTSWSAPPRVGATGPSSSGFGAAAFGVGDINGDGRADVAMPTIAVSMLGIPSAPQPGGVRLLLGATAPGPLTQVTLAPPESSTLSFGEGVAGGLDLDADGYADLVVGAPRSTDGGAVYVFRGGGTLATTPWATLHPTSTVFPSNQFGATVGIGDGDGDGVVDVWVGAPSSGLDFNGEITVHHATRMGVTNAPFATITGGTEDGLGGSLSTGW